MKNNIFTEIIAAWNYLSKNEKIKILQKFEHELAKMDERPEREVVFESQPTSKHAKAEYKFAEPNRLYLYDISSPIMAMNSVIHEDFHADVRRFLANEENLEVLSEINKAQFFYEEQLMDIFLNLCEANKMLEVFKTCFYEEILANENTTLRLMDMLYGSAENSSDLLMLAPLYTNEIIMPHYNYKEYVWQNSFEIYHRVFIQKAAQLARGQMASRVFPIKTQKEIIQLKKQSLQQQLDKDLYILSKYAHKKLDEVGVAREIFGSMNEYMSK